MKYFLIFILFNFSYSKNCIEYFKYNYLSTESIYVVVNKHPDNKDIKNLVYSQQIYLAQLQRLLQEDTFSLFLYITDQDTGNTKYLGDILNYTIFFDLIF